jgi:hypothetical protein
LISELVFFKLCTNQNKLILPQFQPPMWQRSDITSRHIGQVGRGKRVLFSFSFGHCHYYKTLFIGNNMIAFYNNASGNFALKLSVLKKNGILLACFS